MKKLNPKPIDIINAAISEIYGEDAVKLLTMFSSFNAKGKAILLDWADSMECSGKYAKAIQFKPLEQADKKEEIQ